MPASLDGSSNTSQVHQTSLIISDDPTPADQAIYIPSVTPNYAADAFAKAWSRPLPAGMVPADLNFLDPANTLFRIAYVMTSAGQALTQTKPCIIKQRDRSKVLAISDSGGYQIASGQMRIKGDADRLRILQFQEGIGGLAMTLDVPTGPLNKPQGAYLYTSFRDCLTATLANLEFINRRHTPGAVRWLNVIQGNDTRQGLLWYDQVKTFGFADGFAIAGPKRQDFHYLCRLILKMADDRLLERAPWIHILGTSELETAVLLTALQRAINKTLQPVPSDQFRHVDPLPYAEGKHGLHQPYLHLKQHDHGASPRALKPSFVRFTAFLALAFKRDRPPAEDGGLLRPRAARQQPLPRPPK